MGWEGWARASEERVISKIFTNLGGPNLFCSQPGEGHTFFDKEKILHVVGQIFVEKLKKEIKKLWKRFDFRKKMIFTEENKKAFEKATSLLDLR